MPDWRQLWDLAKRTAQAYSADNCSHMAAAISYYVLFSIVPLAIFLTSIFGLVVRSDELQERVSNRVVEFLDIDAGVPEIVVNDEALDARYGAGSAAEVRQGLNALSDEEAGQMAAALDDGNQVSVGGLTLGADELSVRSDNAVIDTIRGVSEVSGALAIVGLAGMLWSSSAMFGAIRRSLNLAWNVEATRPIVRQKVIDLAMVLGIGLVLAASIAGTAALRAFREASDDTLGPLSTGTGPLWSVVPYVLPALLSFVVFLLLYRYVPSVQHAYAEVLPGALFATVLFELMKNLFALYVAKFSNYAGAYGALGGVLLFLLWTYLTANILLVGAEVASEYTRMRRGLVMASSEPSGPARPLREQAKGFLRGLIFRDPEPERSDKTPAARK